MLVVRPLKSSLKGNAETFVALLWKKKVQIFHPDRHLRVVTSFCCFKSMTSSFMANSALLQFSADLGMLRRLLLWKVSTLPQQRMSILFHDMLYLSIKSYFTEPSSAMLTFFLKHHKTHTLHFNVNSSTGLSFGDNRVLNHLIPVLTLVLDWNCSSVEIF